MALLVGSCGLVTRTQRLFGGTLPLDVVVSAGANRTSPVAVALLVVYDSKLGEKLQSLTARAWFEQHQQFKRDYPRDFDAWSWEWVPGQDVAHQQLAYRSGARLVLVFADYLTVGAHRLALDPHKHWRLVLGDATLTAEEVKE
ncbi:MAG: type VI secretion protein [Thermoanaerobaculia bacterium]